MKKILVTILLCLVFLISSTKSSFAIYDPTTTTNNKYGIHILSPDEIDEASHLVNSNGGDWGYVTIPIRQSDMDLVKWQKFMDDCKQNHVIPIVRIATDGDYFVKASWTIPNDYYVIDFANFLNSLNWPTKNRYIVVFNETNRGDEWGGTPDAVSYANILDTAVSVFKSRDPRFFIIMGGLDNAAADVNQTSVNQLTYLKEMNSADPGIFDKVDGISAHSYPNPAFASSPTYNAPNGINSFTYELNLIKQFTQKSLPVFITETGWSTDKIPQSTQVDYYKQAFGTIWNDKRVIAVTPFLFHAETPPFRQFSFIVDNKKTELYNGYLILSKSKGIPQVEPETFQTIRKEVSIKTKSFTQEFNKNIYFKINDKTKTFFKWLLNF